MLLKERSETFSCRDTPLKVPERKAWQPRS